MKFKGIMAFVIGLCLLVSLIQYQPSSAESGAKLAFSSVSANYFAGGPNFGTKLTNAYDGDPSTFANYAAHKAGDRYREGTYFLFDLGQVCDVSKITVIFANPVRTHNFELYTSVDGISYEKIFEFTDKEYGANGSEFNIVKNIQARYIKLMALGAYVNESRDLNENYHLAEVAAYGKVADVVTVNRIEVADVVAKNFASGPNFGQVLEHLTDGNPTTSANYAPHKGDGQYKNDPHFLIDLGDLYELEKVALITAHPSLGNKRILCFDIYISQDNESFEKVYSFFNKTSYGHDGYFNIPVEGVARYIKFSATAAFDNGTTLSDNYQVYEFAAYGTEYVEPVPAIVYAGAQIRTLLVPYKDKNGDIHLSDLRQGLRFAFTVPAVSDTIKYMDRSYTVVNNGAIVALQKNLDDLSLLTYENIGSYKIALQDELIEVEMDGSTYQTAYIYNIPQYARDENIAVRAFVECEDEDGNVVYLYSAIQVQNVLSVYETAKAEGVELPEDIKEWCEDEI
jgi:hypothetical protein